jgi:hypothetical protein
MLEAVLICISLLSILYFYRLSISVYKTHMSPVVGDRCKKKKKKSESLDQILFETKKRVNIEEQKQKVLTAQWSVIVQALIIPGVDAASYAGSYLNTYY